MEGLPEISDSCHVAMGKYTAAFADTTDARCDIYLPGSDKPLAQYLCVFSQRQGYITIERDDASIMIYACWGESR